MPALVFRFGYESPVERSDNEWDGTDFESSQWGVIDASDEAAALAWGCDVAEQFVRQMCGESWRRAISPTGSSRCPSARRQSDVRQSRLDSTRTSLIGCRWLR